MKFITILIFVFSGFACGRFEKREFPDVNPQDQSIAVGTIDEYILDPTQSSQFLVSGKMIVEVTSRDDKNTIFKIDAHVKTNLGEKNLSI